MCACVCFATARQEMKVGHIFAFKAMHAVDINVFIWLDCVLVDVRCTPLH